MISQEFEYDVREQKMPDIGMVSMLDAETGETQLINTGFKKQFDSITRNIIMMIKLFKHSVSSGNTTGLIVIKLLSYFKSR
jgi:hypothetical protein